MLSTGYAQNEEVLYTCEAFPKAEFALGDRRKGSLAFNFEEQSFLHFNARLCDIVKIEEFLK